MNLATARLNEGLQEAKNVKRSLVDEAEIAQYATHAPITYADAKQFLASLGKPDTMDDTMRVLAVMRVKYAQEMLAAMRKAALGEQAQVTKRTCDDQECCYHGQPKASSCLCHKEKS